MFRTQHTTPIHLVFESEILLRNGPEMEVHSEVWTHRSLKQKAHYLVFGNNFGRRTLRIRRHRASEDRTP